MSICFFIQVQLGQVEIKCPITECFEFLEETTVVYNLTHEDSIKYKYFLELGRIDSSTKPCPQCKHFTTFKKKGHIPTPSRSESKYKVSMLTRMAGYRSHDKSSQVGQLWALSGLPSLTGAWGEHILVMVLKKYNLGRLIAQSTLDNLIQVNNIGNSCSNLIENCGHSCYQTPSLPTFYLSIPPSFLFFFIP